MEEGHGKELRAEGYDSKVTVAATWEPSIEKISEDCPAAAALLNLSAFLAPDGIPLDVIRDQAEHLPEPLAEAVQNQIELDAAVAALKRYSLAERKDDDLFLHRLVQAVTRDRLSNSDTQIWVAAAVNVVNGALPSFEHDTVDVGLWPLYERLLPHGLAAAGHGEAREAVPEASVRLFGQMGFYRLQRGDFALAKLLFERALAICEKKFGPDHPMVAINANNLGSVFMKMGELEPAKGHFERALAIDEKEFGPDHPKMAIRLNNLGGVLLNMDEFETAMEYFERALAIVEKDLGPDHPRVATCVNNLGSILQNMGEIEAAREHFERALAIDEKEFGPDHPKVAICVNNLGNVLYKMGEIEAAREHFERALAISIATVGADHPDTQLTRRNLEGLDK